MKSRKDLQRMEFALKQIKNPPQEVPMATSTTYVDKKVVEPEKQYKPLSEKDAANFRANAEREEKKKLKPEPGNLSFGGINVAFSDGFGNMYDKNKERIKA